LTDRAKASLEEIADYYFIEHSASRAEKVLQSIYGAFDKIAKAPMQFALCLDIEVPKDNIRQMIVHSTFKVIYRIKPDSIEIIEVFHGNRNDELLKDIK
jgi:plasmid stabilization system protein ParE